MKTLRNILVIVSALLPILVFGTEAEDVRFKVPATGLIKVAFVVSPDLVLIDMAGPMQTFDHRE